MTKLNSSDYFQRKFFLVLITLFTSFYSISQNSSKIIGSWVCSGNNVYLYDFLDAGKLTITSGKSKGIPETIENGWKVIDDSIYIKEKRGKSIKEYAFKIVELDDKKMILNHASANAEMVFYKVKHEKKSTFSQDILLNHSFNLEPVIDSICMKISFQENNICTIYHTEKSGEVIESKTWWKILNRDDNVYLMINDFEIFVIKEVNNDNSEVTVIPYGFYKVMTGVNSANLKVIKN